MVRRFYQIRTDPTREVEEPGWYQQFARQVPRLALSISLISVGSFGPLEQIAQEDEEHAGWYVALAEPTKRLPSTEGFSTPPLHQDAPPAPVATDEPSTMTSETEIVVQNRMVGL